MKNVLFFTHHLSNGGAEKTVCMLSEYINSHCRDLRAYICVVYDDAAVHKWLDNVIVLKHKSESNDNKFKKAIIVFRQISEMRHVKKDFKINVCVSFLPGADIINVLSLQGEKDIVSVRSKESFFTHSFWKKVYVKASYRRCNLIVAVSEVVRQDVISYFEVNKNKVITIHNAVLQDEVRKSGSKNVDSESTKDMDDFSMGRRVVISVVRLGVEKGQIHLIRAFSELTKKKPDICLVVIGDGEERDNLKKAINYYNLNDKVLLAGYKKNPSVYLKKADVFVLPSIIEGMPNVILEAMKNGLPVVSTDCGAREVLAPGTDILYQTKEMDIVEYGILVPLCADNTYDRVNIKEQLSKQEIFMAEGIERMLTDFDLANTFRNRNQKCLERFSVDNIMNKWINVLSE